MPAVVPVADAEITVVEHQGIDASFGKHAAAPVSQHAAKMMKALVAERNASWISAVFKPTLVIRQTT